MVFALVPAPTALIGEYPDAPLGSVVYGVVMAMAGLSFLAMRAYVSHHGSLLCEAIPPAAGRQAIRKGWISPLLYTGGALLALVDTRLAWGVYVLVPLIYILPGAFEKASREAVA
jgi:uncharacterized membrane protein